MGIRLPPSPLTSFSFITIVGYLMIGAFGLLITRVGADPGLGWHLKTGEIILSTKAILYTDPFLWNFEHQPWVSNQWLADVILYAVFAAFSWLGVHLFCFFIAFSAFYFVLAGSALNERKPIVAQNIAFGLAILCGAVHWITRPVVFSLLGFALVDAAIRAHRDGRISNNKFCLMLIPLFAFWANLHPAFVLGLLLLGLYALSALLQNGWSVRRSAALWVAFGLAVLASALNPYGFGLHTAAFELGRSDFFMNLNTEWRAPTPVGSLFIGFYVALLIGVLGSFRVGVSVFDTVKALVFLVLALKGARFIPFFGIAVFPALVAATQTVLEFTKIERFLTVRTSQKNVYLRAVVPGLFALVAILLARPHDEAAIGISAHHPMLAIRAAFGDVQGSGRLPVFHTPDWGGPIIWETYPQRLAWIDDRNELNGEKKYRDFLTLESLGEGWRDVLADWKFGRVLTRPTTPLASYLATDREWRKIFEDKSAVVFERVDPFMSGDHPKL